MSRLRLRPVPPETDREISLEGLEHACGGITVAAGSGHPIIPFTPTATPTPTLQPTTPTAPAANAITNRHAPNDMQHLMTLLQLMPQLFSTFGNRLNAARQGQTQRQPTNRDNDNHRRGSTRGGTTHRGGSRGGSRGSGGGREPSERGYGHGYAAGYRQGWIDRGREGRRNNPLERLRWSAGTQDLSGLRRGFLHPASPEDLAKLRGAFNRLRNPLGTCEGGDPWPRPDRIDSWHDPRTGSTPSREPGSLSSYSREPTVDNTPHTDIGSYDTASTSPTTDFANTSSGSDYSSSSPSSGSEIATASASDPTPDTSSTAIA